MSRRSDPRHRRAGVSGQFLPTQLAGCVLWLRADLGITLNSGNVSAWADQSGSGHSVSQGTGSAQPTYVTIDAAYGNKATLSFASASSQVLQSASWTLSQPCTQIVVGNVTSSAAAQGFVDFQSAGTEQTMYNPTGGGGGMFAGVNLSAGAVTSPSVLAGTFNGASSNLYLNNSQTAAASGSAGTNNGQGGIDVGSLGGGAPSAFLNGKIAEMIMYNRNLGAAELKSVFAYLGSRYGIATS
jgi:hypothetical protein